MEDLTGVKRNALIFNTLELNCSQSHIFPPSTTDINGLEARGDKFVSGKKFRVPAN